MKHEAQLASTRQAIYVYSPIDSSSKALAAHLQKSTRNEVLSIADPKDAPRLETIGFSNKTGVPALLLPQDGSYVVAHGGKRIEEILSPLFGARTQSLNGSITALAGAAIWLLAALWWRKIAYFGFLWPALGAVSLGIATPNCPTCVGSADYAWVPLMGLAAFGGALLAMSRGAMKMRWSLWLAAGVGPSAALFQSFLLFDEPKLCAGCLLAAAAAAGLFASCRYALTDPSPRLIVGAKVPIAAALALSLFAAGRSVLTPAAEAKNLKSYLSTIGRSVGDYVEGWRPGKKRELVLVSMSQCKACDNAKEDLVKSRVPFREIPYQTVLAGPHMFKADFSRVAPLFLICDADGKVLHAEAGWPGNREERNELLEGYKQTLGGDDAIH